jgi:hypothetical protein
MSVELRGGPFRDQPSARVLLGKLAEAERFSRRKLRNVALSRVAVFLASAAIAVFVPVLALRILASVVGVWFALMQGLAFWVDRKQREAMAAIFSGARVLRGVHAGERVWKGSANVALHLDAQTFYLIAPPELARAIADAARAAGLPVTTTTAEIAGGDAARKRGESLADTADLLEVAPIEGAAELAAKARSLREAVSADLTTEVAAAVDVALHDLAVAVHAARLNQEHNESLARKFEKKGLADPFGFTTRDRFSSDLRAALAELERALG